MNYMNPYVAFQFKNKIWSHITLTEIPNGYSMPFVLTKTFIIL